MEEYITVTAKTVKDAILEASLKLETFRDNIEYEVIEEGSTGFLGFGSKKAIIKARKKVAVEDILKEEVKPLLQQQVSSSVKWQQTLERMISDGVEEFVEIGPGKTLSGFLKKIDRQVKVSNIDKMEDFIRFVSEHAGM